MPVPFPGPWRSQRIRDGLGVLVNDPRLQWRKIQESCRTRKVGQAFVKVEELCEAIAKLTVRACVRARGVSVRVCVGVNGRCGALHGADDDDEKQSGSVAQRCRASPRNYSPFVASSCS